MSVNRFGSYADCIKTIFVTNGSDASYEDLVVNSSLNVDENTLYVDPNNNRVGVNIKTPTVALDVVGAIKSNSSVTASTLAGLLTTAAQTNITSLGTQASNLNMGGFNVTNAGTLAGTLTTAAQTNVTSLGTQASSLNMGGFNITNAGTLAGTLTTAAQTNVTSLGTQASSLNMGGFNITNAGTLAGTLTTAAQTNVTRLGTQTADLNMGGFNVSNAGSLSGTVATAAQPMITSLGSLTGLTVNAIANLNDSLYLGAYVTNVIDKGIFFRASSGAAFREGGSSAFSLSITTWDQSTINSTPDSMSFNAFDGFRFVTNSSSSASTVPMSITGAGVTTISTLTVTNAITNKQTPKAFINFNGNTSTINNSFNVSSITRNSTGNYTITFTNAMLNNTYAWFATAGFDNFDQTNYVSSPINTPTSTWKTTTSLRVRAYYGNNLTNVDPTDVNVIIFN